MGAPLVKGGLTRRAIVLLVIALVVLSAASLHRLVFAELPGPVFEFSGETMGTNFLVKVAAASMSRDEHAVVASTVTARLAAVNALMSTWDPDSELSRFNRYASTDAFPVSGETLRVLAAAREVSEQSGGAFDVTIRPLVQVWGFGDGARVPGGPDPGELSRLRERVGWQRVELGVGSLSKSRPDVVCDLSAIAKGYAVDAVSGDLVRLGYRSHLVEVGGELRARGHKPNGSPWRVAIEVPEASGRRAVHRAVPLVDRAMATSGDYRNYYEQDGVRISHTIDPRSGHPIRHGLASVTVIHEQAMFADAWATALNVLGPEEGFQLAVERGLAGYFIVREKDGTFGTRATPAFEVATAEDRQEP
jgi:thiamine biosynthesis lipoprotein